MLDTRVVFSVNTDLDSWDYENLKYIRKISILEEEEEDQTLSYVSEGSEDEVLFIPSKTIHQPPPKSKVLNEFSSCYLLDVVLVANESVLCDQQPPPISPAGSTDSFTSAIQKGFFEMDLGKHGSELIKRKENFYGEQPKKVETFHQDLEIKSPKKSQLPVPIRRVSWQDMTPRPKVTRLDSAVLQIGYAKNWVRLGNYVQRLHTSRSTTSKC